MQSNLMHLYYERISLSSFVDIEAWKFQGLRIVGLSIDRPIILHIILTLIMFTVSIASQFFLYVISSPKFRIKKSDKISVKTNKRNL